jgi:uracil-DNA glycosylase family 4
MSKVEYQQVEVPGEGPLDADIVLIGEAPAKNEIFEGRPFVGSAGEYMNKMLALAELPRESLYITNVSKVRAPNDKMEQLESKHPETYKREVDKLIKEINDLENPKILVPMGAHALKAITSKRGISNWRGCPTRPIMEIKHDCVVVPTYHPSTLHYNYVLWILIVADFMKVKRIQKEGFEWPQFNFIMKPTYDQVMETLDLIDTKEFLTIDIETPKGFLSCIGLGWSRHDAICIPFFMGNGDDYWTLEQEVAIMRRLSEVLDGKEIGAQNNLFDFSVLWDYGLHLSIGMWDSMLMHHCLYSEMPHTLDIITSIYTDLPFYKKDEDEEKGSVLKAGEEMKHWEYNLYDVVGCFWAIEELKVDLEESDMLSVYIDLYAKILPIVFKMNMTGVRVDMARLKDVQKELRTMISQYCEMIEAETGYAVTIGKVEGKLNLNSPKQVGELLFDNMNMTPYAGSKTGKDNMHKLSYKYETEVPDMIVDIKSASKELSLFTEDNIDNGRIKCEYSPRTDSGRFKSKKGRMRGGMNLQNVKRGPQRKFFIPESGHVMVIVDQKQAEAVVTAMYADDENMISVSDRGSSLHIEFGKRVFGEMFSKAHEMYVKIKSVVHGSHYGMGPRLLALTAGLPQSKAKEYRDQYFEMYPGIKNNFHQYVETQILNGRTLYNPFGRREVFLGRLDLESYQIKVFQKGYSFLPQSTVTDVNKTALKRISKNYKVILETHDGLGLSIPEKELHFGIEALQEAYDVPITILGRTRVIAIEISYGPNWDEQTEINL